MKNILSALLILWIMARATEGNVAWVSIMTSENERTKGEITSRNVGCNEKRKIKRSISGQSPFEDERRGHYWFQIRGPSAHSAH